jgi:hypothetical protein
MDVPRNTSSAAYAVVNASRITGAAHLMPEEPNCTWGASQILSFGQRVSVRLVCVFSGGWSIWCFAVYRRLVLVAVLYPTCWFFCNISYPALVCARSMLALTSATPGMPYADVRALGISSPGRSPVALRKKRCCVY